MIQMEIVRRLWGMNNKLRQRLGIPLSQELHNIAFGGKDANDYYIDEAHREELVKACEIVPIVADQPLGSLYTFEFYNNLNELPKEDYWQCIEENGVYLCLDTTITPYLKERHTNRMARRKEIEERKQSER